MPLDRLHASQVISNGIHITAVLLFDKGGGYLMEECLDGKDVVIVMRLQFADGADEASVVAAVVHAD